MGTLKDMYKKTVETDVSFPEGPRWGPLRGQFVTEDFERKVRCCSIRRPFLLGNPTDK